MGKNKNVVIGDSSVTINGDVICGTDVTIGACVEGNVKGSKDCTVYITGYIHGNVEVEGRVEVMSGASVEGNITCDTIIADAGSSINGTVKTSNTKPVTSTVSSPVTI